MESALPSLGAVTKRFMSLGHQQIPNSRSHVTILTNHPRTVSR